MRITFSVGIFMVRAVHGGPHSRPGSGAPNHRASGALYRRSQLVGVMRQGTVHPACGGCKIRKARDDANFHSPGQVSFDAPRNFRELRHQHPQRIRPIRLAPPGAAIALEELERHCDPGPADQLAQRCRRRTGFGTPHRSWQRSGRRFLAEFYD